jgi:hypothetical protein
VPGQFGFVYAGLKIIWEELHWPNNGGCILHYRIVKSGWWFFGDDDYLGENVVASWYKDFNKFSNNSYVVQF